MNHHQNKYIILKITCIEVLDLALLNNISLFNQIAL
jgi:hypothetical protein